MVQHQPIALKVTNVSVDNEYTASRENGNYKLKIGPSSRTLTGKQKLCN